MHTKGSKRFRLHYFTRCCAAADIYKQSIGLSNFKSSTCDEVYPNVLETLLTCIFPAITHSLSPTKEPKPFSMSSAYP